MIKVNKFGFACLVAFAAVLIAAYDAAAASASSCYPRDIVMMVDESASSKAEFNKIKALCKSIVKNFDVGTSTDDDYFALYGYTDSITKKFPFGTFKNKGKLNTKIGKLSRVNTDSSSLPFAVDYALKILDDQGRSSSQKVIIIVADGVLDIPSNPSTSVYDVCDNIADASELTSSSLQSCLENLVEEAVANDVVVIHVPTDNIDDADNVFTSSDILPLYVKEVSSSSDAVAESCAAISSGSTTDTASTGSPTPAPTLLSDTSCYVSNKQYTNVKKVSGIENPIKKVQTAAECGSLCYATDGCEYFTLNPKRKCFLYKSAGSSKYKKGKYFSGPKYCSRVAEEATAEPTPSASESLTPSPSESLTPSPSESLTPSPTESLTSSPTAPPSLANAVYDDEVFLSSTYSMSFDFTLDYTNSEGPQSIIQRGTKMNANGYVRQPALFVDEGTSKLRFRTSTSEFSNKGCNTTTELELGKTYEIKISVTEGETANLYIDGDLGCTIEYTADETLLYVDESLPLYIGCPDNFVTASGTVENLMWEYETERPTSSPTPPTNAPTTGTPTESPTAPPSLANAVYDDEVFLSSTYSMSFDFTLDYTNSEGPQSIIQRGTKMNANGYVRQPALFVDEGTSKLRFRTSTSEFSNKGCNTTTELELGKTYEIKISVTEGETANLYIDGDLGCTIEYTADETLLYVDKSLPLYIGCPDNFVTASGTVENLKWEYKTERPTSSPTPPTNAPTTGTPTESPTVPPSLANAVYDEEVFLSSTYSMSFDFTLDNTNSKGPQSVIQRGTRHTSKGYVRQPAVFAGRGSSKLLFRISTSVNSNRHCDTTTLELGKTYQIDITVTEGDAANIYIDGDLGCSISFAASEKLLYVGESLPLYIGGPDNFVTASGTVENLMWDYETERPTSSPTPPTNAPTTGTPTQSPTPPTNAPTTGTPTQSPTPPTNAPTTNDLGDDTLELYESSRSLSSTYTLSFWFSYANDPSTSRTIILHGDSDTVQPKFEFTDSHKLQVSVSTTSGNDLVCITEGLFESRTYSVKVDVKNNQIHLFVDGRAKCHDNLSDHDSYSGVGVAYPVYITNDSDFTISNVNWS